MDMSGEQQIPANREQVWEALNNPKILRRCIPGCEKLVASSPTQMVATIKIKIGPLSRTFISEVTLTDLNAPESYTITTQGGIAKASTDVKLREVDGQTVIAYTVQAKISPKLALLGAGLIKPSAKKVVDQFFDKLQKIMTAKNEKAAAAEG